MTVTSLFTYMAGYTPFLSIQQVMAGIEAKVGPGLRGRMGRLEACEESIKGLWVDVGRRRKNNPRSVWLLGDDKATPEEGPVGIPASFDRVIAVDTDIEHPYPSHTNLVSAPGSGILTTTPHGSYDFLTGTSLAAAHVSGVVALLLERDPNLSTHDILKLLRAPGYNDNYRLPAASSVSAYAALAKLLSGGEIR